MKLSFQLYQNFRVLKKKDFTLVSWSRDFLAIRKKAARSFNIL